MKIIILGAVLVCASCRVVDTDWAAYGGGKDSRHYSELTQIDTNNVTRLGVAWTYHCGDADSNTQIQVNGLEYGGVFYGVSPQLKLFALDAATGRALWTFDPRNQFFSLNVCRGLTMYRDGDSVHLFYGAGSRLFCVDAQSGKAVETFGKGGWIDLHEGLDRPAGDQYMAMTSPGIVYKDMIIVGDRVEEETPAAPGDIRAFDVHSGLRRWIFHTIPHPGEAGYETWDDTSAYHYAGGVNTWAGFSLDEERGILFAPTGSASYDFYGGNRTGNDLYANCVLALDAATGKRIWHFQTVHHDLWDRDLPAAPVLVTLHKEGKSIDAIAQITKSGFVFLFDRQTGQPVYPVTETPVPAVSELPGEKLSPTQPVPAFPPFARQHAPIQGYHNGFFEPPSREGTVIFPGFDGGGEWGGPSFDPGTGILYVNANEMAWILTMVDVKTTPASTYLEAGKQLYAANCMSCHGPQLQGGGNYPSLQQVPYTLDSFVHVVTTGRRMMPGFPGLSAEDKEALASYILKDKNLQRHRYTPGSQLSAFDKMRYTSTGYIKYLDKNGLPGIPPPWGTLTALDLNAGRIVWQDTLGDYPGIHSGTENYGGSVVTAGGVLFIAATRDHKIRAFNKRTGRLLWSADLPACGFATPTVYSIKGKEYVVIACGGGKLKMPSGDSYVAFALP